MVDYNPFDKPLQDVRATDLYSLEAPEGEFYEYKRALIEKGELAKSVASFSNTHGGLLFIGVDEDSETNRPSDWFTLTTGDPTTHKESVRNSISERLSPVPSFSTYSIRGSNQKGNEGHVLVINVPESPQAPHITNSGVVYRRAGEGSDPYDPVTDPGVLDRLYERRENWNEKVAEFCKMDFEVADTTTSDEGIPEAKYPALELYCVPSTLNKVVCEDLMTDIDGFKETVESSEVQLVSGNTGILDESENTVEIGLPADTYRSTGEGMVAQQWLEQGTDSEMDMFYTPLTFTFLADGGLKVFLPIPISHPEYINYNTYEILEGKLESADDIKIINGDNLLTSLYTLLSIYLELLDRYDWPDHSNSIEVKAKLRNINQSMIYFDAEWYQNLLNSYGPPVNYEKNLEIPRLNEVSYKLGVSEQNRLSNMIGMSVVLLESFGIPSNMARDIITYTLEELMA